MDNTNINPLEGSKQWCAVESTDSAIAEAYWLADMENKLTAHMEDMERKYAEQHKAAR